MELPVNAANVKILLGAEPKTVPVIPTASNRKRVATGILNTVAREHPSYLPAIHTLTVYPILKWILSCREKAPVPIEAAAVGVLPAPCPGRRDLFGLYREAVSVLEEALSALRSQSGKGEKMFRTLMDIHANGEEKSVSIYQLNVYYRDAVLAVCGSCCDRLADLCSRMSLLTAEDYMRQEGMVNPAYEACRALTAGAVSLSGEAKTAAAYALSCLSSHPKDPVPMSEILTAVMSGVSSVDGLRNSTDYAWNTIARYRTQATHSLAALIWGYSVDELIFSLWEAQIEEQENG